ncbi:hypothetical protein A2W54_01445 [Candidatus Giovannonibacteria bacterium RIFCSPHIGHO2_02_43_13]|uniref:Uncharacterized protein n=1 Tax=Candidatus Giovannonibacteria bacterium RIFCSPHIGHO2_02_43_13 TaxID=1798330 RepID=A0A1F5WUP4_9BACT|nr:MAG: hypothetical protein UW28_C0016G0005 [Parcubacteria group bacterium GW2011_GWA2_44_13]OGF71790.1 MAG: hypothetical protein A3E06_01450 [Candidatus Giovannonibacteria bacterium RIFCSPHIGHO2_12_FULL_44_42]OGF79377.1 MAG: hypothetical protein A2W54_01445 [Candidatus Giovannonibacteria bacterium RIFCSPHIGHO2_02_43_13]OGF89922.1 MAG: hypothetical protein A3I94_00820 [Candidatus Giovannonibacteria bacterium RIFCSPLOWO2_02_FULL_43_54]OGF97344.1 MAG: hypothetical protein A3H08_03150 [Candidatus
MTDKKFFQISEKYQKELKSYIQKNFGRKCGHIGKDQLSLDCVICKTWVTYEFFSWFVENLDDLDKWEKILRRQ